MSFTTNNFTGSIQPQLGSYLHGSGHFQKNYYSQQTPCQFFHPAAVAAMAAAAAGYSQFGTRLTSGPLNLTSVPGYRNGYGSNESDETRGSYSSGFGLHDNSYTRSYTNGFSHEKQLTQFPFSNTAAFQSLSSGSISDQSTHRFMGSVQSSVQPGTGQITTNLMDTTSRGSRSHSHKSGHGKPKLKKSMNSQELAIRKRQEFDELVKARTDKLLSSYTPATTEPAISGANSACLSTGATVISNDSSNSPNYKKLIEAVLDAKKSALLRSPSVVAYIEAQQRSLAEFKRRTELFCVDSK